MVKVFHIRRAPENVIYVGRKWAEFSESPYHNPFPIGQGLREDAILNFAAYWFAPEQKALRIRAESEIPVNAALGCWCVPEGCHGDIIAGYLNRKSQNYRAQAELF